MFVFLEMYINYKLGLHLRLAFLSTNILSSNEIVARVSGRVKGISFTHPYVVQQAGTYNNALL